METNYRQLCMDLFGTTDVEQLKTIANQIKVKNPRNAGRKRKFAADDIQTMKQLAANGTPLAEVAAHFHTSRQVVGRYLNEKPASGYTMRITYMCRTTPCTIIDVDFMNRKVAIQNRTTDVLHRAFGIIEQPTWEDFETFLRERCFPSTRGNIKTLLKDLQLTDYDPLQIVEKTQGRTAEDHLWLKFAYYPKEVSTHG